MELFERVRYLCEIKGISQTKLGKKLGVSQSAFNRWLKKDTEHNLWDYLPRILELFPDVRQEWLYMGREPMLKEHAAQNTSMLEARVDLLEREVKRLRTQIFVEGASDQDGHNVTAGAAGQGG